MIIFDELSLAEKISKYGFKKGISNYELSVYAKWLVYSGVSEDELESKLVEFCKAFSPGFKYETHYGFVDAAIKSTKKYVLRVPKPTPITEFEWNQICRCERYDYRKVLFVMLIIAKYFRDNNTKINRKVKESDTYYCLASIKDILSLAEVKMSAEEVNEMFHTFYCMELIGIRTGKSVVYTVEFVDTCTNVLEEITDYDHIMLHFDKLSGLPIGVCKTCGKLFKQNKNGTAVYCRLHRRHKQSQPAKKVCVDCHKAFVPPANNPNKTRCDECYPTYRRLRKSELANIKRKQK